MDGKKIKVVVITGPTASGKSSLAVQVARELECDIISADSRQIYKGIPISTAVPSLEERGLVTHHLLEFLGLGDYYSAASFEADAIRIIDEKARQGCPYIVVCGGSMMYVDALLYGMDDLPSIDDVTRERVKRMFDESGIEGLRAVLGNLDPDYASFVDVANPRRVMHALELCLQTGGPLKRLLTGTVKKDRPFEYYKFVLQRPRAELFERINRRVDLMVKNGMEQEARAVYHLRHLNSLNTIGFKEWFACFDGKLDRASTILRIGKNTRVYAKKQLTWLARQADNIGLDPETALKTVLKSVKD